ncbi:MAG: response regulator [Actinomycetales bacterium]
MTQLGYLGDMALNLAGSLPMPARRIAGPQDHDLARVDALLLDLATPADLGTLRAVLASRPELLVVTISATGGDELADAALVNGTSAHLELPLDIAQVQHVLDTLGVGDTGRRHPPTDDRADPSATHDPQPAVTASATLDLGGSAPDLPRALIVDDDAIVAETLAAMVRTFGLAATLATTRKGAIEQLASGTFDLVLCDSRMPDATEDALLDAVAGYAPEALLVVMSGVARRPPRGALFFLKPLVMTDVQTLAESVKEQRRQAPPG